MAQGTGEKTIRDPNEQRSLLGLVYGFTNLTTYADAIRRNIRTTIDGFLVAGHAWFESAFFTDEEIRDTNPHLIEINVKEFPNKLVTFESTLNQDIDIEFIGRRVSGGTDFLIATFTLSSGGDQHPESNSDAWAYLVVIATSSVAPTAGELNVHLQRQT